MQAAIQIAFCSIEVGKNTGVAFIFGLVYQWLANPSAINLHTLMQHYRDNTIRMLRQPTS
ncbi:hypothetical protein [Novosphingobium sp.]|uniref:hypothetical protein n=1 Tax=Novosphingobium sp. TaxID=1874826 RepID=UPI001DF2C983|nr:hypothetical protein [Novosphingobium sp.]MBX9664446.1 hypothetical protein [Novosphingobium sp.]